VQLDAIDIVGVVGAETMGSGFYEYD